MNIYLLRRTCFTRYPRWLWWWGWQTDLLRRKTASRLDVECQGDWRSFAAVDASFNRLDELLGNIVHSRTVTIIIKSCPNIAVACEITLHEWCEINASKVPETTQCLHVDATGFWTNLHPLLLLLLLRVHSGTKSARHHYRLLLSPALQPLHPASSLQAFSLPCLPRFNTVAWATNGL